MVPVAPDYAALRARIEAEGRGRVWIVGGGGTQRGALDGGMLDELRLFVMPVIVGGGPLVFGDGGLRQATLIGHRIWPKGVVELEYRF